MKNFQDTSETRKQSFISAFSICMTVPLNKLEFLDQICPKRVETINSIHLFNY